jgi:hypothetical protein
MTINRSVQRNAAAGGIAVMAGDGVNDAPPPAASERTPACETKASGNA